MRKSKSNPAKYAKGYRKISQRRMTSHVDNEEEEILRLREMLRSSTEHLSQHCPDYFLDDTRTTTGVNSKDNDVDNNDKDDSENEMMKNRKKRNRNEKSINNEDDDEMEITNNTIDDDDDDDDNPQYITDDTVIILPSRNKRKDNNTKIQTIYLSPEEIKAAKAKHKAMQRKLQQIESRHEKKKRRTELYKKLSDHAVSDIEMSLLQKSSELGKKLSKKEMLRKILQKERAGIPLTQEEKDLLYVERDDVSWDNAPLVDMEEKRDSVHASSNDNNSDVQVQPLAFPSSGRKKKKSKKKNENKTSDITPVMDVDENNHDNHNNNGVAQSGLENIQENTNEKDTEKVDKKDEKNDNVPTKDSNDDNTEQPKNENNKSFADMMMAGLTSLKTKATNEKKILDEQRAEEEQKILEQKLKEEEEERKNKPMYKPSATIIPMCPAVMGIKPAPFSKQNWRILPVDRPEEIKATRYDLPVSSMEFEIIDSIRNHSVTILCSETGSGKSTQVPQFLYESGITLGNASSEGEDDGLFICVTQPRRVAAVSTAKRVCYEMGHSTDKGQSIRGSGKRGEGNLVAYQTKYESAGVGSKTRIKFMTDGILLQEIKADLLLRKYAVIVLDEAHERNLNTDVLLGLLSAALPLRRQAALEGSLPPLKLVIMSATLRIEDFTANGKLFVEDPPNLVKVPGRTYPVTIHHSKTTELDDYEGVALQKVCKIHQKLPKGGILVFLTGKQEIIRMVNRLRRRLTPKSDKRRDISEAVTRDIDIDIADDFGNIDSALRDMDDDEADGDLYQNDNDEDNIEDSDNNIEVTNQDSEVDDNIPKKVLILPLYSLLSVNEQAKVFKPVDEDTRLIVVSTNIAETSLTIPNISYVVDCGRQKCRNYHAGTGIVSYDVMWISKASADQRAGRAGRTGPGHCYRIYSSSIYSRHLDPFALPEVLTRPLEDVVLAMKAMGISNVGNFPFPTSPDSSQLNAAVALLANIGCIDTSKIEIDGGDGEITKLGTAIAKLPIGVRYGKMLLVSAQANVLDYGIVMVACLSESSPFINANAEKADDNPDDSEYSSSDELDEVDRNNAEKQEEKKKKENRRNRWCHSGGDVLAAILATGAFSYAGKGAGGHSENLACKRFCEENGLNLVVMQRIQKMRIHLARLAHQRLGKAEGIAAKTGKVIPSMSPPTALQENLLRQSIASGLLDNVARRATQGHIVADGPSVPRTAYFTCRSTINEPLFIDKKSVIFSRDPRQLPEWICFDTIIRKTTKKGDTISMMTNVTPIDPNWLGALAEGSKLLSLGEPIDFPAPKYDKDQDEIICSVVTKYGDQGWLLPPIQVVMSKVLSKGMKQSSVVLRDDPYRWFARSLLNGVVFEELKELKSMLNDDPSIITRRKPMGKVAMLVSSLAEHEIDSATKLTKYWAEEDSKFLFKNLKSWVKSDKVAEVKKLWIATVKGRVLQMSEQSN